MEEAASVSFCMTSQLGFISTSTPHPWDLKRDTGAEIPTPKKKRGNNGRVTGLESYVKITGGDARHPSEGHPSISPSRPFL